MSKNIRTQMNKVVGKSLNAYYQRVKPTIDDIKFKEQYQGRIIDCMIGEVDNNYIETPETDAPVVKLEHSKEGLVKIPTIKGKTILVDEDGNETDTPREGCRLVSVGEEEDNKLIILSKNKNLFNKSNHKIGYIDIQNEGNWVDNQNYLTSDFISVKSNTTYIRSGIVGNRNYGFYNLNKEYISGGFSSTIITPKDCRYIRLGHHVTNDNIDDIQLEENTTSTFYVKPKSHKTEILLNEPLRSLPNGVCDEIVGNQIIRRIGSVTLDGDKVSSIGIINDNIVDVLYFDRIVTNKKFINYGSEGQQLIKSNIYRTGINANNWNSTTSENTLVNTNSGGFWIFLPKFTVLNIEDARNYMNNKPTEVLYELEEPIIEELPNGITLQGFDDTTMYIENSITPTVSYGYNALIPYKQELLNQKEEVETNTLDIEQNIIPYLMDMEFNLMLMEGDE